ncbi:DUF5801 repeats-in-toxin domain-containing protein [Roseibium sp.]|uniref:T1SS-143 repeat domain-containing protein n=1 Tax=Roseibium sp. TaxID=1936156 RepID=UPI0039F08E42
MLLLQPGQQVDFRQILDVEISFVRVGDDLELAFADGGTIIVQSFFSGPGSSLVAIVGDGQILSLDAFSSIAALQTATEFETAAGGTTTLSFELSNNPGSAEGFRDANIGDLGDGLGVSDLLQSGPPLEDEVPEEEAFGGDDDKDPSLLTAATDSSIDEGNLADGNEAGAGPTTVSGDLGISFGEDAGASPTLVFDTDGSGTPLDSTGTAFALTSDNVALEYTITDNSDGGQTLVATKAGTSEVVFTVTLEIVPDAVAEGVPGGSYTFTLSGNLDHVTGATDDELPVSFAFTGADTNGDSVSSSFQVTVVDDDVLIGDAEDTSVDEEGLATGSTDSGYDGDLAGSNVTSSGDLDISWGSDNANPTSGGGTGDRSVVFSETQSGLTGLTSNGSSVSTATLSDGTLVGYTGSTVPSSTSDSSVVFHATLSDSGTGSYSFTLVQNLDHPEVDTEDDLELTFAFTATDGDGDTASSTFSVIVDDDALVIGDTEDTSVDEEGLATGTTDSGYDGDLAGSDVTTSGDLAISWGADDANPTSGDGTGDRSVAFSETQSGLTGLTTNGLSVSTATLSDGTLVGYTGSTAPSSTSDSSVVFHASLSDSGSGSYSFTLVQNLDHPEVDTEDDLELTFAFTATDSDGDTASSTFSVTVDDDAPAPNEAITVTVDEDDIDNFYSLGSSPRDGDSDGSTTGPTDAADGPAYVSGSLASAVSFGADGPASDATFSFADDAADIMEALGLTSNGESLSFEIRTSGGDVSLFGYVDTDSDGSYTEPDFQSEIVGDRPIISLQLDANGDYVLELFDQLDHVDDGNTEGTTLVAGTGSIDAIDFGAAIVATDGDDDTLDLSGQFQVAVRDDVPEVDIWVEDYVRIDETYGLHSDNSFDPFLGDYDPFVVALFAGVTNPGSNADLPGPIYADYTVVNFDGADGADEFADIALSLQIDDADSGLFTTEGDAITLTLEDGLVVGRIPTGEAVFAIHIDDCGCVSIAQYQSLMHPDDTSSDEHIDLAGKLSAVIMVTDADGDTATASVSIGEDVTFDDEGPTAYRWGSAINVDEATDLEVQVAGQLRFDGGADGATVTDVEITTVGGYVQGLDQELSGPARFGDLTSNGSRMTATTTESGGVITINAVVEGSGARAFELVMQPDGSYTFQQFVSFDHPDSGETGRDDFLGIRMLYTVTDGDGDTDSSYAFVRVWDDGAEIGTPDDVEINASVLDTADTSDDAVTGSLDIDWGVDVGNSGTGVPGDRSVSFADTSVAANNVDVSSDGSSVTLMSGTETVNFGFSGDVLVGYTGADVSANQVFTVSLDDASGEYEFTLLAELTFDGLTDARDNVIDLAFDFVATDSDDDDSGTGTFTVTVDGAPAELIGDDTANTLTGTDGADAIYGLGDADTLSGGLEDDYLIGGLGADNLTGGAGNDTYVWDSLSEVGDTITDFDVSSDGDADDDRLDLGALLDDVFGGSGAMVAEAVATGYVRVTQSGVDPAVVEVDSDGGGDSWTTVTDLTGLGAGDTVRVVLDEAGTYTDVTVA